MQEFSRILELLNRNGQPLHFVFWGYDPLHDLSAWGRMESSGVEWGRNREEGEGGRYWQNHLTTKDMKKHRDRSGDRA